MPNLDHTTFLDSLPADGSTVGNGALRQRLGWEEARYDGVRDALVSSGQVANGTYAPKIFIKHGQLLFAWSGSRGTSFGPHIWGGGDALLNYHTWKVEVEEDKVYKMFLYHKLKELTVSIEDSAHGASALVHTQKCEMEKRLVGLPKRLDEQRAIAAALGDVDALLAALDAQIAKQRDLKQATMQQLLTGQTRLPGFTGEWEVKRLGQLGHCIRGVSYRGDGDLSSYDTNSTKRLLRSNNVQESKIVLDDIQFVNASRVSSQQILRGNDLLICMANGSKDLVGKSGVFLIADGHDYTFGAFMGCFRTDHTIADPVFVRFLFQTDKYRKYISNLLAGSSINNLRPSSIESLAFSVPPISEQTAIANAVVEMDQGLNALESRRSKTAALKQSLMQALLTGRIRLVPGAPGTSPARMTPRAGLVPGAPRVGTTGVICRISMGRRPSSPSRFAWPMRCRRNACGLWKPSWRPSTTPPATGNAGDASNPGLMRV